MDKKLSPGTKSKSVLDGFDIDFYRSAYKDVRTDAFIHYQEHGHSENRLPNSNKFYKMYPDFDLQIYQSNNRDLAQFSKEELMSHFHHHGCHEGRMHKKNGDAPELNTEIKQKSEQRPDWHRKILTRPQVTTRIPVIKRPSLPSIPSTSLISSIPSSIQEQSIKEIKDKETQTLSLLPSQFSSKNYIEPSNFIKIDDMSIKSKSDLEININSKLRELILQKNPDKPIYLIMAEWGYPPFGGGECWLIDTMKWLSEKNYACYYIYFHDHQKRRMFEELEVISYQHGFFIQFPPNYLELLQFVKLLGPSVISHQGLNRMKYMKYANLLEVPFVTGFCFWHDLIKMQGGAGEVFNKDMINKKLVPDENFQKIYKNSVYCYVGGQFVNEIVNKVHNVNLDVINTVSDDSHYKIDNVEDNIYVTVINICGLKGGSVLDTIISNTNPKIPFLLIDSQNTNDVAAQKWEKLVKERNEGESEHKSIYFRGLVQNIKSIYKRSKILLVLSLVDETFCRVAYEGMMNEIPILSTNNGNLKYLMKGYADILDANPLDWAQKINKIYYDEEYLSQMKARPKTIEANMDKEKFVNQIIQCSSKKVNYLSEKHVGLFCPWGDQGLGIQCREYYDILQKLGYTVCIYSFKPYHATPDNPKLQTDPTEWDYQNIYYSSNTREETTVNEVLEFIYHYKIKKMIIVETCFDRVFDIAKLCRMLSISVYAIPNLETIRYMEVSKHQIFNKILCNNSMTYEIMNNYFPEKTELLGFRILNKNYLNRKSWDKNHYSFFCSGGLNALSRKNIDKVIKAFKELETERRIKNFKLYVYIQGVEVPENVNRYNSKNLIIKVGSRSYKEIAKLYKEHDIFIHMGDHEGLGLGFYESIACGTPVFTINTPPNNEIIKEGHNGWLVRCDYDKLNDNNDGIVKRAVISIPDIKLKLHEIIINYSRRQSHESTTKDYLSRFPLGDYVDSINKIMGQ